MAAATPTTRPWMPRCSSKATGRPVRVQYTRDQGTGWDPKGPASIHRARAAIDANGQVIAYEFVSKGFSRVDVNTNGSQPHDTLAGHLRGIALKSGDNFGMPAESYEFANKKTYWETIPPLLDRASPLRSSHLRDPVGPQIHFASESFMDEVAHALNVDPLELRLRHVKDAARHRGAQGGGREGRLGDAAVAATRPDRQHRDRPRHRLLATQRHPRGDRGGGRGRPLHRQDLVRASSPSRMTAARSSIRPASSMRSRATSCRASAARSGRRSSSTPRT